MQYEFTYKNTPADYWKFYMGNTYKQWTGIVNVVFTAAMIALIVSRWQMTNGLGKTLMVIALLIFPVFQPLAIYLRSVKESASIRPETTVRFDENGMEILVQSHRQHVAWKEFYPPMRRPGLTVVIPDAAHAYLIPDRITGEQKEPLYQFIAQQVNQKSGHRSDSVK